MHSKRQQVLDKLAERCLTELSHGSTNIELVRLYLEYSRAEAAALPTAIESAICTEKPFEPLELAKALAELVRAVK